MSYSDRLKDIHDKETSETDESFYIERNCSQCNTCMKVSIKHLPKKIIVKNVKIIYHA